jgi:hypothetical protein
MRDRQHLAVDAGREERKVLRAHRTPRDLVRGCGRWVVKRRALVLSAAALGARDAAVPDGLLREWDLDPLKGRMRFDASAQLGLPELLGRGVRGARAGSRRCARRGARRPRPRAPRWRTTGTWRLASRRYDAGALPHSRALWATSSGAAGREQSAAIRRFASLRGCRASRRRRQFVSMSPTAWALRTLIRRTAGAGASRPRSSLGISPTPRLVRHPRPVARAFGP